jgi:hypothetical protein
MSLSEETMREIRRQFRERNYVLAHRAILFEHVSDEMDRQLKKWGDQIHPDGTGGRTATRLADQAKARCARLVKLDMLTWDAILDEEILESFAESDNDLLRAELIQSMAVIGSWIRDIDRRKGQDQGDKTSNVD